jgi:phage gp36-like protein
MKKPGLVTRGRVFCLNPPAHQLASYVTSAALVGLVLRLTLKVDAMTYATRTDLEAAWSEQTVLRLAARDGDESGGVAEAAALAYADNLINAQLGVRFALPLPQVPPLLVSVGVDLAIDRLAATADMATDLVVERGKQARADLKAIAEGRMELGLPTRVLGSSTNAGPSVRPIVGPGGSKLFGPETRGL